ncbi:adenosine kinase [Ascoidea rubescens DSM 1968]|uniref:Adenosine kinase n=1 Tax=Ascoidea rubescens DSM 1968 TaxID=1344418 RepID=A0A1D2VC24_9ASCO|nr:adenosine kinase [Ascoidea rubescens DSM 1968]ODV59112.1 adenosine kinase [Ascoidea rubescens DSM 1968]
MSFPLVCLGNPLLDLQCNVDASILKKYDLNANDAILADQKHIPLFSEVLGFPDIKFIAGGAAQNTARAAQYILPSKSVVYFGSVGKDKYSELLLTANEKAGLISNYMFQDDFETGKCVALISNFDRSLVTDLAAANHFEPSHLLKPENWKLVENAKIFYIGGFHLTVSPAAIKLLGKHAAETNKPLVLNLSAAFIPQFFKNPLDEVLPYCDFVICNETEAESYAASHNLTSTTDLIEIAKSIAKSPKENLKYPRTVIFTHGLEPTITVTYKIDTDDFIINEYSVHALEVEKIVDTNGAGDAFAGGFVAGLVLGKPLKESIDIGHWAAKVSIQQVGPSFPYEPKQVYPGL